MTEPAVTVERVWKRFRRGERQDSLRDVLALVARGLGRARRPPEAKRDEFWALRDVSFTVRSGEALGIVGPNGAGKSTMLKLLTRLLPPTHGELRLRGRVAALIELSAGFHPDLTGRENAFLQGAMLGMTRREMTRKLDAIVDFSGLDSFLDTPVKRYSSGMIARLGFAVAAHLEPDVLLVDEVLAVGDMAFQAKCLARMEAFKREGVAVIFVSHDMQAVGELCDRALFLHSGVQASGQTGEVLSRYVQWVYGRGAATDDGAGRGVAITGAELTTADGAPADVVTPGTPLRLRVTYVAREPIADIHFGLLVYRSADGFVAYDGNFQGRELGLDPLPVGAPFTVTYDWSAHLLRGQYHLACHVAHNPTLEHLVWRSPIAFLRIDEMRSWQGVADLAVRARVEG